MVDTEVSATESMIKFFWTLKGKILSLEIALCLILIICKAVSLECYLWCPIIELVWAIIIFIIYGMELQIQLSLWTDFFRAITASLILLITSIICFSWAWASYGEVAGSIFGLLAAGVFGYDTLGIITYIKEQKEQGKGVNVILM